MGLLLISAPTEKMAAVLRKTVSEAKDMISKVVFTLHGMIFTYRRLKYVCLFYGFDVFYVL
jgi:hypothetical protein